SGKGSAARIVPARMSTLSKSANAISGLRAPSVLIAEPPSRGAVRLEQHARQGIPCRRARPDDELECLEIAFAGFQRGGQEHLDLLAGRFDAAGKQQRLAKHDGAFLLPQVEMTEQHLLVDQR